MAALLNRQRLDLQANGSFLYRSRPFQVLRYEIRPEVGFTANWSEAESALRIVFQHNGFKVSAPSSGRFNSAVKL